MARSSYIYLIRLKGCGDVVGAFTVKKEANTWAVEKSGYPLESMSLSSMRDGIHANKTEKPLPWETAA